MAESKRTRTPQHSSPAATTSMQSMETSLTHAPDSAPHPSPIETPLPESFGRYKILKELGKGAMGVVYLAEDTQLDRQVALKIPKKSALEDADALERFYREARTTSRLRHPNICPVFDVGSLDGMHYLTMGYIPGKPVSHFVGKKLPSPRQVALLIRKIARALDAAHQQGIIHRDLKPSNVMLDDCGEPIVMDFGLARNLNTAENARLTQSGAILGTPAYMAPEQVQGDLAAIGPQTDVYALGVMMYQFLTGQLPFAGPILLIFAQIMTDEPQRPSELRPDVDPRLEAICVKMMAKGISRRFHSMHDVAAALTEYLKSSAAMQSSLMKAFSPADSSAELNSRVDELAALPVAGPSSKPASRSVSGMNGHWRRRGLWTLAAGALLSLLLAAASFLVPLGEKTAHLAANDADIQNVPADPSIPVTEEAAEQAARQLLQTQPVDADGRDQAADGAWIEMLPQAELSAGSRWQRNENSLIGFGGGPKHLRSQLLLPVQPKGGYEIELRFQLGPIPPDETILLNLPVKDHEVTFACRPVKSKLAGFSRIVGQSRTDPRALTGILHQAFVLRPNQLYRLNASVSVAVDQADVLISLDGAPWVSWTGPIANLSRAEGWKARQANALGLAIGLPKDKKGIASIIVSSIRYRELRPLVARESSAEHG